MDLLLSERCPLGYSSQPKLVAELSNGNAFRVMVPSGVWRLVRTICCQAAFTNERDAARRRRCVTCSTAYTPESVTGTLASDLEFLFEDQDPLRAPIMAIELQERLAQAMRVDYERERDQWIVTLASLSGSLFVGDSVG